MVFYCGHVEYLHTLAIVFIRQVNYSESSLCNCGVVVSTIEHLATYRDGCLNIEYFVFSGIICGAGRGGHSS